jgi:hypothetical protein
MCSSNTELQPLPLHRTRLSSASLLSKEWLCSTQREEIGQTYSDQATGWMTGVRIQACQDYSLPHEVQGSSGTHTYFYPRGSLPPFFLGTKSPVREASHAPPSNAVVRNLCNCTSTGSYVSWHGALLSTSVCSFYTFLKAKPNRSLIVSVHQYATNKTLLQ